MTLSEAKSKSKSVIDTLRSLGVPDVEILARLVSNMGFSEAFVRNQLSTLLPPKRQLRASGKTPPSAYRIRANIDLKSGSLRAIIYSLAGDQLFNKDHMRTVREALVSEGYNKSTVETMISAARRKFKETQL